MKNADQKAFFQGCLYTALIDLMEIMPYDKISIGVLCDKAGVSRTTYYRSYNCKEDILIQHLDECFGTYLNDIKEHSSLSVYDISRRYFSFLSSNEKRFFLQIVKSGLSYILMERFYIYFDSFIGLLVPDSDVPPYIRSYLTGGIYKLTIDWICNGMDKSENEMAEILSMLASTASSLQ